MPNTSTLMQADLFAGAGAAAPPPGPEGLRYRPDMILPAEEEALAGALAALPLAPFDFHGHLGNRRVAYFGRRYDYDRRTVEEASPLPDFLDDLRIHAAGLAQRPADDFVQCLVNEYRPGAGIGWHRDKPQFGDVVGFSLLAPCTMRFRRRVGDGFERLNAPLAPRSGYLLRGPARSEWEHSVTPLDRLRYSVTFRTLA